MKFTLALASALLGVANAAPQGVTDQLTPTGAPPAGCTGTFNGNFEITVAQVTKEKRSIPEKRAECGSEGTLVVSLSDGTALDAQGRTGYIASNYQFQFDKPAQAGAIFNSGFSVCENNIVALGSSKTFYQCRSGSFYNLYDRSWAAQCEPVSIIAVPCGAGTADQSPDGQVVGTTVVQTTIVTALPDGQPQVVTTSVPVPIYSTYVPVSEYTDGQIQVTPTGPAPPPPPAPTPSATETAAPPPPPETTPVSTPVGTPVPLPTPVSSVSVSTPAPVTSSSSSEVETPSITTPASTPSESSTSSAPAPPATTSAPPTGGSSHVAAGSLSALVVGMVVAFLCL
ncbi:hypothetical protein F4860DRAFT_466842 [Xylaria cubensis]|nr:hypothetical protein F4860DRAFT_466842 [Xylaria cubensis]